MTVKELTQQLQNVEDQNMEIFIERMSHKTKKAKGVYLVFVPIDHKELPNNCIVIES